MMWVEWVEPFSKWTDSDAVYMRVSAETATKFMQRTHGIEDPDQALAEFVVVNWATLREDGSDPRPEQVQHV